MFSKSWFFSENRPKSPFRGKGLFFGGHDENGQNEAEAHGFGNRDAKISADRKSTRLNSSHTDSSRMPSSA